MESCRFRPPAGRSLGLFWLSYKSQQILAYNTVLLNRKRRYHRIMSNIGFLTRTLHFEAFWSPTDLSPLPSPCVGFSCLADLLHRVVPSIHQLRYLTRSCIASLRFLLSLPNPLSPAQLRAALNTWLLVDLGRGIPLSLGVWGLLSPLRDFGHPYGKILRYGSGVGT
jgi:hypothetical protein